MNLAVQNNYQNKLHSKQINRSQLFYKTKFQKMKKMLMLTVGLITAQIIFAQSTNGDGYITWNAILPECKISCPNASNVANSKFAFVQITQGTNIPINQIYGDFATWTHNPVKKVEFSFSRATRTKKCGSTSTDSTVMLQNLGGKFDIKPSSVAPPSISVNATVSGITGTITFAGAGADLWEANTNITRITMKPNFAVLPAIQTGCTETYSIPVVFKVTFGNGCTSQAVYDKQIKLKRN